MSRHENDVRQFMVLAGRKLPTRPAAPDSATLQLCSKLIMEEFTELMIELGYTISLDKVLGDGPAFRIPSLARVAKEACDLRYVVTYLLASLGIDAESCQELVDKNNLEKFGPGHSFRADGKLLPPAGFEKVTLEDEIRHQTRSI